MVYTMDMKTKLSEKTINVHIDGALLAQLDAIVPVADPERQSRNAVIRLAIRRFVAEMAKEQRNGKS